MPGRLAKAWSRVRQPKALISSRVMTLTTPATSLCFCSYLEAVVTVVSSNCSRLSSVGLLAARTGRASARVKPSIKAMLTMIAINLPRRGWIVGQHL